MTRTLAALVIMLTATAAAQPPFPQQSADELKTVVKTNDWNHVHIIARGNTIIQILNGSMTSIVVDDDSKNRALGGLLGFQMHVGAPMKVEFRRICLKNL
ncbi:MAG TPA: family 16 glycoside hydrolase [Vicinamibacterales bacterium]|nr:family 16 glycoside hydrolase [Vicinamibacterales bacterium]